MLKYFDDMTYHDVIAVGRKNSTLYSNYSLRIVPYLIASTAKFSTS